MVEVFIN
jgi:hypothetical protein